MGTDRDRRPFPDGQRVYHQLRWDPRFDADACEIVLLDRHAGTKVIAFRDYLPNGPIPWHRIVGFRYRGEVLWDRASRIDRRTEALGQAPHGLVTAVSSAPVPRRPLEVQPASRPALPVEPVIVTWNVLSNRYEGDVLDHPTRWRALLDEVMAHTPDLVAFTEATTGFVTVLEAHALRQGRSLVRAEGCDVVLLTSATPQACEALELAPGRTVVVSHFDGLTFAGLHLPSDRHGDRRIERERDLHRVGEALLSSNTLVLAGDFNAQPDELDPLFAKLHGLDAWCAVNPGLPGLTYDVEKNAIAGALTARGRSGRLDRIVTFGERSQVLRAALLGVSAARSDHFGLVAQLAPVEPTVVSHRSALVLLPPASAWGPLQRLRARFDPRFERWPPHLTLLFGFVEPERLEDQLPRLQRLLQPLAERTVRLDEVLTFEHEDTTTVALGPDAAARRWLTELQAQLVEAWPWCTEQNRGANGAFMPHLTLGRVRRDEVDGLRHAAKALSVEWTASEIGVLERPDDRFELHAAVSFGAGTIRRPSQPARTMDALEHRVRSAISDAAQTCGQTVEVRAFGSRAWGPPQTGADLDLLIIADRQAGSVLDLIASSLGATRVSRHVVRGSGFDVVAIERTDQDEDAQRFALGAADASRLRERLDWHGRTEVFDVLLPEVRRWARRRGLERNAFGYFGGLGWAVLVAAPLLFDEVLSAVDGPDAWRAWRRWAQRLHDQSVIGLDGPPRVGARFTLRTPAAPERDITRSLITSTERVLLSELHAFRDDEVIEADGWLRILGPIARLGEWQHRALACFSALERECGPVLRPVGTIVTTASAFSQRLGLLAPVAVKARTKLAEHLHRIQLADVSVILDR
jgi:poly(A) polymerase